MHFFLEVDFELSMKWFIHLPVFFAEAENSLERALCTLDGNRQMRFYLKVVTVTKQILCKLFDAFCFSIK